MSLPIYHLGETYTAARATPTLVGRREILPEIKETIYDRKTSTLIYIMGAGGVGKTRLIRHILDEVRDDEMLLVARELIDLYHTRNRSVGGLAESIVEVLAPLRQYIRSHPQDSEIDEKLEALARAEQEGLSTAEVVGRRQELSALLLDAINDFSVQRRLVLALDTAERLYVVRDEAQEQLGLIAERPAVLDWLLHDFLPRLKNATILIAGRPEPLNLTTEFTELTARAQHYFSPITLSGLTEEETLAYFDAVVARAEQSTSPMDQVAAEAILRWSDAEKRTVFYCLHDGGDEPRIRPILLALAIDHLVVGGRPLQALTLPLQEAKALGENERRQIEVELNQALVRTLREHHRPADEVIVTLGWLRKGADITLLQRLTGDKLGEVEQIVKQIRDLSFVKIRPADERIFLHDEMYDILQRYALGRATPDARQPIFITLQDYYAELIQTARQQIDELYQPQADTFAETLPDPAAVRETRARLHDAIVEDIYYRLRWQPIAAFQQYCLYAEEAIASNDENLWAMLRAELFSFLAERRPEVPVEVMEELRRNYVVPDSAVRWVAWLWSQDRYDEALATAEKLAANDELIRPGGTLVKNYLDAWRGLLFTYAGNYGAAEKLLTAVEQNLLRWSQSHQRTKYWAGTLAVAYNALGYLYSFLTRHYQAISAFAKAAQLWQTLKLTVGEANTLNNRAYELAKIGDFAAALPAAKAALRLREQLGPRTPVGLGLNTLGLIELAQFDLEGGLRDIRRATEIFRRLDSLRGLGLALIALAEAERRISISVVYLQQGRSSDILVRAVAHAQEAVAIFTNKVQEPPRLVEALRELARAYRDWARLRRERPTIISQQEAESNKLSVDGLAQLSHEAFEQAKRLLQEGSTTEIELLYDEALLIYYTRLYAGAPHYEQAQMEVEKIYLTKMDHLIPTEFHSLPGTDVATPRVWSFVQRGNVELLRGHLAFNRWAVHQQNEQYLYQAVEHYTFALTYYAYFSNHIFQERRQSLDELYEQLLPLSAKQKRQVHEFVHQVEIAHKLKTHASPMSQFLHERFGELDELEFEF